MVQSYEHTNGGGTFTIAKLVSRTEWRATPNGETLVTGPGEEAVLKALLANMLDARPKADPGLDTSRSGLPKRLSEWRQLSRY